MFLRKKQAYERDLMHGLRPSTFRQTVKDALFIVFGLFALLALYGWTGERDLANQLETTHRPGQP